MILTAQQKQALENGEAVPISVDHTECVVVRRDIYDRVKKVLAGDDFDPKDAYPLVNEIMREDDKHDPLLEGYQQYRR